MSDTPKIKKKRNTSRDYVSGPEMHIAIKEWYDSNKEDIPRTIENAVIQICERLGTKNNFKNYSYLDEMIGEAKLACVKALREKKYDPENWNNPFAYFTQIAFNEFRRYIKLEHKEVYIKHKSYELHQIDSALNGETIEVMDDESGRLDALVRKFEKRNE